MTAKKMECPKCGSIMDEDESGLYTCQEAVCDWYGTEHQQNEIVRLQKKLDELNKPIKPEVKCERCGASSLHQSVIFSHQYRRWVQICSICDSWFPAANPNPESALNEKMETVTITRELWDEILKQLKNKES